MGAIALSKPQGLQGFAQAGAFSKLVELLGAAGCAAFFVTTCALGLEVQAEKWRSERAPVVRVAMSQITGLVSGRWGWSHESQASASTAVVVESQPVPSTPVTTQSEATALVSQAKAPPPSLDTHARAKSEFHASGWVLAGQMMQFSFRPAQVIFRDSKGVATPGIFRGPRLVEAPPATTEASEYSFVVTSPESAPGILKVSGDLAATVEGAPSLQLTAVRMTTQPGEGEDLDFRPPALRTQKLVGRVLEGDQPDAAPISGAEVVLVGEASRVAITDSEGRFDLGELGVPAHGRAFLEARRPEGFKHRFEVRGSGEQTLFLMAEGSIEGWRQSIEGGLSPRSGWVIGAVSNDAGHDVTSTARLRPIVESEAQVSKLVPETYMLDAQNALVQFDEGQGPAAGPLRWLSVELPEGGARVGLIDSAGDLKASAWTPVSPGVINVIPFAFGR